MKLLYTILIDRTLSFLWQKLSKIAATYTAKKREKSIQKAKKQNDKEKYNSSIDGL